MPASIFSDMERSNTNVLEEQRALQLAMELSMFTLGNESESGYSSGGYESESRSKKSQNTTECVPVPSSEHVAEIVGRQGKCHQLFYCLASLPKMPVMENHAMRSELSHESLQFYTIHFISYKHNTFYKIYS